MKRYFLFLVSGLLFSSIAVFAQGGNEDRPVTLNDKAISTKVFKIQNPAEDKTGIVTITGLAGATFTASNTADGSANSYQHAMRITLGLQPADNKLGNFQVVFYTETEKIPYAVTESEGMTSIYYPLSVYEGIRQRLEQAVAARKKVQVKVIQKKDGYREGSLIF